MCLAKLVKRWKIPSMHTRVVYKWWISPNSMRNHRGSCSFPVLLDFFFMINKQLWKQKSRHALQSVLRVCWGFVQGILHMVNYIRLAQIPLLFTLISLSVWVFINVCVWDRGTFSVFHDRGQTDPQAQVSPDRACDLSSVSPLLQIYTHTYTDQPSSHVVNHSSKRQISQYSLNSLT